MVSHKLSVVTVILGFCAVSVVSGVYLMVPIIEEISKAFGVSEVQAAMSSTVFSIGYAIGVLLFGPLSDKFGHKQIMLYGMGAMAVITLMISFAQQIEILLVLRAVQGFIATTFAPVALEYVFTVYPAEKRSFTIAILTTGFLMAGVMGQVISSWITKSFGWSYVFLIFALAYFLAFMFIKKILPETPRTNEDVKLFVIWKQMFGLLRKPDLIKSSIVAFTTLFSFVGMYASLGGYLNQVYGFLIDEILVIRAWGVLGICLSLFVGKFIVRYGSRMMLNGGLIAAILGLLLMQGVSSIPFITLASVIFVAGISLVLPALITIFNILGSDSRGGGITLYTFVLFAGASIGPLMRMLEVFRIIILVIAGILFISLVFASTIKLPSSKVSYLEN